MKPKVCFRPHHLRPLSKKEKNETSNFHYHGLKIRLGNHAKTAEVLDNFGVAYEKKVVSAHRTPDLMFKHAEEARSRGIKVIIAGAGGAAHLPGMVAAKTTLPVIGVPVKSRALSGVDSLYSIVQMPGGVPVATMAIGEAGATNAALFALRLLSVEDKGIADALG